MLDFSDALRIADQVAAESHLTVGQYGFEDDSAYFLPSRSDLTDGGPMGVLIQKASGESAVVGSSPADPNWERATSFTHRVGDWPAANEEEQLPGVQLIQS